MHVRRCHTTPYFKKLKLAMMIPRHPLTLTSSHFSSSLFFRWCESAFGCSLPFSPFSYPLMHVAATHACVAPSVVLVVLLCLFVCLYAHTQLGSEASYLCLLHRDVTYCHCHTTPRLRDAVVVVMQ
jgi:hypothetical protein